MFVSGATKKPYHTIQETLGWHETTAEMGVSDKYRRCSPTKTIKCRSRYRGLAETDVFVRRKSRKPTRSVWPQCSQTNRRVYRILSNYEVAVGFSRSASRAMTSELELETIYTARLEMSRAHLGWMISRSRGNIVLWLCLALHAALEECLETNRVAEFPLRSLLLSSLALRDTRGERYFVRSKVYETEGAIFRSLRSEVSPLTTRSALLCHSTTRNVSIAEQLQQSKCYGIPQHQNPLLRLCNPE